MTLNLACKVGIPLGYTVSEMQGLFFDKKLLNEEQVSANLLEEDVFALFSDWFYFAILELLKLEGVKKDRHWIQERLSLGSYEAELALKRLSRLGFIENKEDEIVLLKENNTWVNEKSSSDARRNYQRQILQLAIEKLNSVDFSRRDQSSLTVAIAEEDYINIVKKIKILRKEINLISTKSKGKASEVYQLSCSFFPLTV